MKNKKLIVFSGIIFGLVLIMISFASAFAVSSKYWEDKPLELYPGEFQEVPIFLQNMAGDKDITVQASVTRPAGMARILGDSDTFLVPLGQKVQINVSFIAAENAVIGTSKDVILNFKVIDTSESKNLGMGSGVEKKIPVVFVSKPVTEKESSTWIYVVAILVVLVIVFVLWKLLSRKSRKK